MPDDQIFLTLNGGSSSLKFAVYGGLNQQDRKIRGRFVEIGGGVWRFALMRQLRRQKITVGVCIDVEAAPSESAVFDESRLAVQIGGAGKGMKIMRGI